MQQSGYVRLDLGHDRLRHSRPRYPDHIPAGLNLAESGAHNLAQQALGSIALYGSAHSLSSGEPKSAALESVLQRHQYGQSTGPTTAFLPRPREVGRPGQAVQAFQFTFLTCLRLTTNWWRPRNRRAFSTLRPARVAMRARKLCTRARRRIFG